jgi:hypothetical protein
MSSINPRASGEVSSFVLGSRRLADNPQRADVMPPYAVRDPMFDDPETNAAERRLYATLAGY